MEEIAGKTIEFSVWATDGGNPRRECLAPVTTKVTIGRVNLSPPAFNQSHYAAKLFLPTVSGVKVLCVKATDPDIATDSSLNKPIDPLLTYSILSGDVDGNFEFRENTGCIFVKKVENLKSEYNLTLKASDGTFSSRASAEISVEDTPKTSLRFTQEKYWVEVLENTTKPENVVALGIKGLPTNHHIIYTILNPSDYFEIRPTAGIIKTTGKPFDREEKDHHILIVQVDFQYFHFILYTKLV